MTETLTHIAPLWRWTGGKAAWFFVTIGGENAEALAATALMRRLEGQGRGFGSIRVRATIGDSRFDTSVFPQKNEGYILPVKAGVRRAEGLAEGDEVTVTLAF